MVPIQSVVQKKKQIIMINSSRRFKLRQKNKLIIMEICLKSLEYIEHILLYRLICENRASCTAIRSTGSDMLYQEVCDDF